MADFLIPGFGEAMVWPRPVTAAPTPPAPTLNALTLSNSAATAGSAWSATISGATAGSTITASSSDGTVLTVAAGIVSGTFAAVGSPTITLTEALAGATNTPRPTPIPITVGSAATALPQQGALFARWSADDLALANGAKVTSWTDRIGGAVLSQGTTANQPTFKASGANGKPAVNLGGSQCMGTPAGLLSTLIGTNKYTVMVFIKGVASTSFGMILSTTGSNSNLFAGSTSYTPAGYGATYSGGAAGAGDRMPWDGSIVDTGIFQIAKTMGGGQNGTYPSLGINGCTVNMGGVGWAAGDGALWLGSSTPANSGKGDVYEIMVWNVALTPAEILQAYKWASERFASTPAYTTYGKLTIAAGDSQTYGTGATNAIDNYASKAFRGLGLPMGTWMNIGQSSAQTGALDTWSATAIDGIPALAGVPCNLSYLEWYNIRTNGGAASLNLNYCKNRKTAGFNKIGLLTCLDSSDHPAGRAAYLSAIISGYAANGISDLIRIDQNANVGVDGSCPSSSPYGTYFADGVHPTTAGYEEMRTVYQPVVATW